MTLQGRERLLILLGGDARTDAAVYDVLAEEFRS
jgi:hypothetical protein